MKLSVKQIYDTWTCLNGSTIRCDGWIKTIRASSSIGFIELNDGTSFKNIQIVVDKNKVNNYNEIAKLNIYSAIQIEGVLKLTPQMPQPFEIHANSIEL